MQEQQRKATPKKSRSPAKPKAAEKVFTPVLPPSSLLSENMEMFTLELALASRLQKEKLDLYDPAQASRVVRVLEGLCNEKLAEIKEVRFLFFHLTKNSM